MFPTKTLATLALLATATSTAPVAFAASCGSCSASNCISQTIPALATLTRTLTCPSTHYVIVTGITVVGSDHTFGGCDAFSYAALPSSSSTSSYAYCSSSSDYTYVNNDNNCGNESLSEMAVQITCKNVAFSCNAQYAIDSVCRQKPTTKPTTVSTGTGTSSASSKQAATYASTGLLGLAATAIAIVW